MVAGSMTMVAGCLGPWLWGKAEVQWSDLAKVRWYKVEVQRPLLHEDVMARFGGGEHARGGSSFIGGG